MITIDIFNNSLEFGLRMIKTLFNLSENKIHRKKTCMDSIGPTTHSSHKARKRTKKNTLNVITVVDFDLRMT